MNNSGNNKTGGIDDKTLVGIALSATRPPEPGQPCPSAEHLAAFVDGRLRPGERAQLLEHLDACPDCYSQWRELSSLVRETTEKKGATILKFIPRKIFWSSSVALALAACLVLVVWRSLEQRPELAPVQMTQKERMLGHEEQPDQTQKTPIHRPAGVSGSVSPGSGLTRGEPVKVLRPAAEKPDTPARRAFGAGLWLERQEAGGQKDAAGPSGSLSTDMPAEPDLKGKSWPETRWAPFFSLGRLCAQLQAACQSPGKFSSSARTGFIKSLKEADKSFAALKNDADGVSEARSALQRMLLLLEQTPTTRLCHDLEPKLLRLTSTLSPGH